MTVKTKEEDPHLPDFVNRFSITGKRALVSGASRGIGLEVVKVLADAGADIVAVGRDCVGLNEAREAVEAAGRECLVVEADLATVNGPKAVATKALDHYGVIDVLVNNAGISYVENLLKTKVDRWDEVMAVNLRAPFLLAQALAPKMITQHRGKIVNVSSVAGVIGIDDHGAYCASKGGLNMLTKVMTSEWGPHNIQTNAIAPTVTLTPMGDKVWGDPTVGDPKKARIPLGRFCQPIEVADLVLYLCSSASDMICGETILMDGGVSATE